MALRGGLISRVGPRAATAYIAVLPDFSDLHKGIAGQSTLLSKKGNTLGKALGVGIAAGAAGAVGAGVGLFKLGEQFDAQTDKIRVGTGRQGKALRGLQKDFKAVFKSVPTDIDSAGTAVTGLSKRLDLTGRPLRKLSRQVLELSRITDTDLNENIEATSRLFGDWGIETGKQSKTLDKLFRLSQRTGIGISELSRFMVQFGSPLRQLGLDFDFSAAMFARFEKEGVNIQTLMPGLRFALKTFSKEGREPAKALRETFDAIEKAGGAAEANQIAFETFGVRAGPDMAAAIREGRFDLDALLKTMRGGKDTIRGAADDTKDLSERWIEFRNRALVKLEPVATRVFEAVTREAEGLFKILENPRLTTDEKISRVLDRISDLFAEAAPRIAEAAAKAAPKAVSAFVRAWASADVWGKLLIGGFLLTKLGGLGAFRLLGTRAGAAFGQGAAAGAATAAAGGAAGGGAAAGGLLGAMRAKVLPIAKRAGLAGVGIALADSVITEFGRRAELKGADMFKALEAAQGPKPLGVDIFGAGGTTDFFLKDSEKAARSLDPVLRRLADSSAKITPARARELREEIDKLDDVTGPARREMNRLVNTAEDRFTDGRRATRDWQVAIAAMVRDSQGKFAGMRTNVQFNTKLIRQAMKEESGAGRKALAGNMEAVLEVIRRTMRRGGRVTQEGLGIIKGLFVTEARLYGLSEKQALAGANVRTGEVRGGFRRQDFVKQRGGLVELAKGAVVPGHGTGDTVPLHVAGRLVAMVEPGELVSVTNRKATAALMGVNDKIKRFQAGGMIDPAWDPGSERLAASISGRVGAWAKRYRANMTAGYDPGGGHVSPGHNVTGTATDMVPLGGDWDLLERGLRVLVNAGLKVLYGSNGVGIPFPNHGRGNHAHIEWGGAGGLPSFDPKIARVLIGGPDSPLKAIAQGALDRTRSAAQRRLRNVVGSAFLDGTGGVGAAGGATKAYLKQLWIKNGGDPAMANMAAAIALAESSGNANAENVNSDGSIDRGFWQINSVHGALSTFDPDGNARAAVQISGNGSNWNPWVAFKNGNYRQFLRRGGLVEMLQGGGMLRHLPNRVAELLGPKGGLPNRLHNVLHRFGLMDKKGQPVLDRKQRGKLLRKFLKRIKGIGLPGGLEKKITALTRDADIFGDFASRAGSLTTEGPNGEQILGQVGGFTEGDWLGKQLEALFQLRNKLVKAEEIVVEKRKRLTVLIEEAQRRLGLVAEAIRAAAKQRRGLERQLEKARKKPKQNRELIKSLRGKIRAIDHDQAFRLRERNALKERLLPTVGGQRSKLNTARGDLLSSLEDVQGIGSPMGRLTALPALGVLGGRIFDAQLRLRELNTPQPSVTDTGGDSGALETERELRRLAEQRLAVSEAHFDVFKSLPYAGSFAGGGVVPGPVGVPRAAIVHGGEVITDPAAATGAVRVDLHFANGMEWLRQFVRVEVRDETRGIARSAGRALPFGGGG